VKHGENVKPWQLPLFIDSLETHQDRLETQVPSPSAAQNCETAATDSPDESIGGLTPELA